jgi:acetate kinase
MLSDIENKVASISKIGIRIVHGGPKYKKPTLIDEDVVNEIEKYSQFAPIHNPLSLLIIDVLKELLTDIPLFGIFDTGYFIDMPEESITYALPKVDDDIEIRRYGFHGISHQFTQKKADPNNSKKVISVHLGAGCSITAIDCGQVINTSMGMTPLEGLIMQTRSGDIDPGIILYLAERNGVSKTYELIKNKSGLAGLTGTDGAMLTVLSLAGEKIEGVDYKSNISLNEETKEKATLALKVYVSKIKEYIGAYAALMNGVDIIAFTGRIGAESSVIRERVMGQMNYLGNVEVTTVKPDEELAMVKEIINYKL